MTVRSNIKAFRFYRATEVYAIFGVAFAFCGTESWRVPSLIAGSTATGSSTFNASLLCTIVLVLLCLFYKFFPKRLADNILVLPLVALFAAGAIYCYTTGIAPIQNSLLVQLFGAMHFAFSFALLVLWMEIVLYNYADDVAGFMTFALLAIFILQCLFNIMDPKTLYTFAAGIPVLSGACFFGYRRALVESRKIQTSIEEAERREAQGEDTEELTPLPKEPRKHPAAHFAFLCIVWIAFGLLFSMLFRTWYDSPAYAAGNLYWEIQLFTSLGTLFAAVVLVLMSHPMRRGLLEIIIVACGLAAVLLSNMGTQLFVLYLIPMNVAQKLLFVSILRCAAEFEDRQLAVSIYCLLVAAYRFGLYAFAKLKKLMTGSLALSPETTNFVIIATITLVLLAFLVTELISLISQAQRATRDAAAAEQADPERLAAREAMYRESAFHYYLMQKFGLTQRESEMLRLFEEGATVKQIAEDQVVSESTVKSHLSNVYPKLGVATRKEAMERVQHEREQFFTM